MAIDNTLPSLLEALTISINAALESTPSFESSENGISLLDLKNNLLTSYLQNLVFLILLKLRDCDIETEEQMDEADMLEDAIILKLVELRVYLERGVRPLEGRLSYQIQKVLSAAEYAAISSEARVRARADRAVSLKEYDIDDGDFAERASATSRSSDFRDLQYRPNPSSFIQTTSKSASPAISKDNGIYRPPRITATTMRTKTTQEREIRKPAKSATLDEFVNIELSSAPFAEPSVGSTIIYGGRRSMSDREKRDELARREYEEKNYIRLPKESKNDRSNRGTKRDAGYGGEEWRGLGEGIDRIERLTKRKLEKGHAVLEKGRKKLAGDSLPHDHAEFGQRFQKKLKRLGEERRDRGRV